MSWSRGAAAAGAGSAADRRSKPTYNPASGSAPDVSTVEHAARLLKTGFSPEQVGLHKTCTRVKWVPDAPPLSSAASSSAAAAAAASASAPALSPPKRAVRLSAKRGSLTSLAGPARYNHPFVDVSGPGRCCSGMYSTHRLPN